jgi:dipeptidyl aminopeptidase/acylaminoacyl peptidase
VKLKNVQIKVDGFYLKGSIYEPEKRFLQHETPLVILCHGIPRGDTPTTGVQEDKDEGYPGLARRCCEEGFFVFHFNFRGTGESGGNFDLFGWTRDLQAVLNYFEENGLHNNFYLWGFSGGAAVSTYVTANDPRVKALILAACPLQFNNLFTLRELGKRVSWYRDIGIIRDPAFPRDPEQWLQNIYRINPSQYIAKIAPRPLLVMHGSEDELIPCEQAEQLYELAGNPKELHIFPGAGHQLRKEPKVIDKGLQWLKKTREGTGL